MYIGYIFHDLPSQFFSLFRPLAHSSLCQRHEEGGGNWWESDNRGYWVTKERQIDSYKTAEECEQFSSSLFQLGNVLHVIFLYLCTKFIDLCSDPSKSSITFFAWHPILISLKRSHSLQILCRCFSSTYYNRNHLVLNNYPLWYFGLKIIWNSMKYGIYSFFKLKFLSFFLVANN